MKKNNIILIGFMGVGKGTVARALVKRTDRFAIDTDDLIESMENRRIKKIFKRESEAYFRALEEKCALWLQSSVDNAIISTGGGFYKQENLSEIGTVVYLKSSFEGILERINEAPNAKAKLKKRPLLQNLLEAQKLYNERIEQYEAVADVIVDVERVAMNTIIHNIIEGTNEDN
ncbi:MAG: shikimate kinase [Campylobacterota bacterium]|nr:shikimate kinase [Campylobacterota bacterium]